MVRLEQVVPGETRRNVVGSLSGRRGITPGTRTGERFVFVVSALHAPQRLQNLPCGTTSGSDRAVNRAAIAVQVRSFPCEVQSIRDGSRERSPRGQRSGGHPTIRTPSEGVGVPIVEMPASGGL